MISKPVSSYFSRLLRNERGNADSAVVMKLLIAAVLISSVLAVMGWVKTTKLKRMGYVEEQVSE